MTGDGRIDGAEDFDAALAAAAKEWARARADRRTAQALAEESRLARALPCMISIAAALALALALADVPHGPSWRSLLIGVVAAPMLGTWPRARTRRRRFVTPAGAPAAPNPGPPPADVRVWVLRRRPEDAPDDLGRWAAALRTAHPGLELREAVALAREVLQAPGSR